MFPSFPVALLLAGCAGSSPDYVVDIPPPQGGPAAPPVGEGGGDGNECQPTQLTLERFPSLDASAVPLQVRTTYTGDVHGLLLIDVVSEAGDAGPRTLYHISCRQPGDHLFSLPSSLGRVVLVAYIDGGGDGPGKGDPAGRSASVIDLAAQVQGTIEVEISDTPDLGAYDAAAIQPERAGTPPPQENNQPGGNPPAPGGTPPAAGSDPGGAPSAPPAGSGTAAGQPAP